MKQYIDKAALVAEIERRREESWLGHYTKEKGIVFDITDDILSFIDTLEVKELDEMPNPRFPNYKNIVDKVFGAGNLESWEYEEAKQLVLLAKEELLKDIEVKEVDLEKDMQDALRTEYEKGRADVIADTISWLENCWPKYCSNQTIIEGFKEAIKGE